MKPQDLFKPGRIICHVPVGFDPLGHFNNLLQGDTECKHVELMLPNGKIASTGATAGVFYGERPVESLKGKSFFLLETVDPLTADQLKTIQAAHEEMLHSNLFSRFYGIWKYPVIWGIALFGGDVHKTGPSPKTGKPISPICSQAVAYPLWKANIPVGRAMGKVDWTGVLPETFIKEAQNTTFALEQGWLGNHEKPCYMLRTVQDTPFKL